MSNRKFISLCIQGLILMAAGIAMVYVAAIIQAVIGGQIMYRNYCRDCDRTWMSVFKKTSCSKCGGFFVESEKITGWDNSEFTDDEVD